MQIKLKKSIAIRTVEDWHTYAPPKDAQKQWKDGRSAKELARFACSSRFEELIKTLLKECQVKNQDFIGEPEAETYFPTKEPLNLGKNGPRNHDLLLIGKDCVIGIEAKVSEPFDETIQERWDKLEKTENQRNRVLGLVKYIMGDTYNKYQTVESLPEEIKALRYQLFAATVGTIEEAKKNNVKKAIVLIIVFNGNIDPGANYEDCIRRNNDDYDDFVSICMTGGKKIINGIECQIIKKVIAVTYPGEWK